MDEDEKEPTHHLGIKVLNSNRSHYESALGFKFPHKFFPFINTTVQKPNNNYKKPLLSNLRIDKCELTFSLPYPINFTKNLCVKSDPSWDLVKKKDAYNKRINYCKGQFHKYHKKELKVSDIKNRKCAQLPKYLIEIASGKVKDPDPYFEENYDYYYTGGNLYKTRIGEEVFLVSPTPDNKLCLTNETHVTSFDLVNMENEKIYGINGYKEKLLVRQKSHISCYYFGEDNLNLLYEIKSNDIPFICSHLYKKHQLGYLDVYSMLKIDNIETQQNILKHKFYCDDESTDLTQFAFKKNDIIFTNSNSIEILDRRSMDIRSHLINTGFFDCNEIRTFCVDGDYVYILTKHNVVKFDMRQMLVVKKWTHFLALPPISVKKDGNNLIFNSFEEMLCLPVTEGFNYLPIRLPLIKDVFEKRNLYHYPVFNVNFDKRFNLNLTGVEVYDNKIFMGNSVGDLFTTEFGESITFSEDESINKLNHMIDSIPKPMEPLKVTSYRNIMEIKTIMNSETKWKNLHKMQKSNDKKVKDLIDSAFDLDKYEMAKIWDHDKIQFDKSDEEAGESKVTNWLQSASQFNDSIGDIFD